MGIIACVGLLVGSAVVIAAPAGPPSGLDVTVVSPNPLPVTGNLGVTVSGTPNVNVVNDAASPVPVVISEGPTPFQFDLAADTWQVPTGMVAVVESIYIDCTVDDGPNYVTEIGLSATFGGDVFHYHFYPVYVAEETIITDRRYTFSSEVKIFADEETFFLGSIAVSPSGVLNDWRFYISGYLLPK